MMHFQEKNPLAEAMRVSEESYPSAAAAVEPSMTAGISSPRDPSPKQASFFQKPVAHMEEPLNAEQKRRIDQNFRAAKAILSRKRPHSVTSSSSCQPVPWPQQSHSDAASHLQLRWPPCSYDRNLVGQKVCVSSAENHPREVEDMKHFHKMNVQRRRDCIIGKIDDHQRVIDGVAHKRVSSVSDNFTHQHSPTPLSEDVIMRRLQMKNEEENYLADDLSLDLDENILKELDALCEQRAPLAELRGNLVNKLMVQAPISISREASLVPCNSCSHSEGLEATASVVSNSGQQPFTKDSKKESPFVHRRKSNDSLSSSVFSVVNIHESHASCAPMSKCGASHTASEQQCSVLEAMDGSKNLNSQDRSENTLFDDDTLIRSVDSSVSPCLSSLPHILATGASPLAISVSDTALQGSTIAKEATGSQSSSLPLLNNVTPSSTPTEVTSMSLPAFNVPAVGGMPAYLQALNESQREAALSDTSKPLLILAGPGSGKTSTMVARLLTLLKEGVQAKNILAMTFTTAAAAEMKDRVGTIVGKMISKELSVCTFHSFCLQLCRSNADKLGRTPEFLVYGHGSQRRAVIEATRLALAELQLSKNPVSPADSTSNVSTTAEKDNLPAENINPTLWKEKAKKWEKFVSQAKASGKTPEDYEKIRDNIGAAILRHYNAILAACDALDYHDFISCAVALLRDNPEVFKECQTTWTCVLVDEFQDTSTMQYQFLRFLASHNRVTVVGDDDQSIFSFNGADSNGFESFRKDFPGLKEVRLHHNYRSTRCIVEAASSLIGYNLKRCQAKQALTDNDYGDRIVIKECRNEDAQCSFVIDTILMKAKMNAAHKPMYGDIAILYRRQVTGKNFQSALRSRKIPFNVHGVAFYRKKVIKTVIAMLRMALHESRDNYCSRVYKALYAGDKAEAKKIVEYVEKVARTTKCDFLEVARSIFTAKVSGTFNRRQLALGRKVLSSIDTIYRIARKEQSLSALVTAVVNLLPQRSAFEKRAVIDEEGGKFLNEDDDHRTVLEYLLDDVTDFLCNHFNILGGCKPDKDGGGCLKVLKDFLDHMTSREMDNFKTRREENGNSITLTTMHQSKGLEWDVVFIVKANDSEIPLLHETMGSVSDDATSLEEERRLFYVAMTRAKKKLYILYVTLDSSWQLLRPTRFLGELPGHLLDFQVDGVPPVGAPHSIVCNINNHQLKDGTEEHNHKGGMGNDLDKSFDIKRETTHISTSSSLIKGGDSYELGASTGFLRGFNVEARSTVAALFHNWAKKPAFQDPKRLLDKVCFVLDERIRNKSSKNKDTLRALKCCLKDEAAFSYAKHVVKWGQMPPEERSILLAEKQEFFQQQCAERSMGSATASSKQISYLRSLGCTTAPTSRLHASRLIEQYKAL